MSRVVRPLAAVVLLAAALPAAAFLRETTEPGNPSGGTCLWWGGRNVPVHVNASGVDQTTCSNPLDAENAVTTALASWGNASLTVGGSPCTDFTFVPGASTNQIAVGNDGVNLIVFRKGLCAPGQIPTAANNCWPHGDGTTIALTTTSFDPVTGRISDADVEVYAAGPGGGKNLTCASSATGVDIQSVLTHEAGHMLGLDHVCTNEFGPAYNQPPWCPTGQSPVMSPQVGSVSDRMLAPDDVNGVCTIYPKNAATLTCAPVQSKKASGGGCDSAGGAGVLGLVGLLGAWRRRGRRRG
jgi:hypothetical protein